MISKIVNIALFLLILCSCASNDSTLDLSTLGSQQSKSTGLDNWGRGQNPWMSDWEEKQRNQAEFTKKISEHGKKRKT